MRRKRLRAFTLIEVIAALGVIILLTLALVLTIQGQMKRVESQNLKATVATVNSQIEMAYNEPDADKNQLKTFLI
ncbi:Competence protein ComGC [Lacticaseibacillus paracasei subsp. paracasei CNCM I-4649]|nr:Competence protein ComGC [Lacticaseibacillus paracasei subsp. paracasei CNCM I-4649]